MLHWLNVACKPVALLAGSLFPAYNSYRALEAAEGSEDRNVLLIYWICFGMWNVLEVLLSFLFARIPLFYACKLAFLVWLQAPQTQGAQKLYRKHILPLLKHHQGHIDHYLEEGKRRVGEQLHWGTALLASDRPAATSAEGLIPRQSPSVGRTD